MPKLTIQGHGETEVDQGTRLVNAIAAAGVDIGHRCGGYAKCTTCRVRFDDGEPEAITVAEAQKLEAAGLMGEARLACQITVEQDMTVEVLMRVSEEGWPDPGPQPETEITPEPEWVDSAS